MMDEAPYSEFTLKIMISTFDFMLSHEVDVAGVLLCRTVNVTLSILHGTKIAKPFSRSDGFTNACLLRKCFPSSDFCACRDRGLMVDAPLCDLMKMSDVFSLRRHCPQLPVFSSVLNCGVMRWPAGQVSI